MIDLPSLDVSKCLCRADCVACCPTQCLELCQDHPILIRPADCIACEICVYVCPETALRMEEIE
jgi:MinD superfamily P-loop ATPase